MTNSKQNVNCWNCAHFQRYWDHTDDRAPEIVCGECRKRPIMEQQGDSLFFSYNWAFILDGTDKWCAQWKRTLLTVPDPPAVPADFSWPAIFENWLPFNSRSEANESCWNCDHFQRDEDDPSDAMGVCAKNDPNIATHIDTGTYGDTFLPTKAVHFPGDLYCCGSWQKTLLELPEIPPTVSETRPRWWSQRSGGALEIYVDLINGDDLLGDGSQENPYRTFEFVARLPEKLTKDVKLKPAAGQYTGINSNWPLRKDWDPSGTGRLIVDASGETWPVIEGGLQVAAITPLTNNYNGQELANEIQVTPNPGWATDEQYPMFINVRSGAAEGYVFPIFSNGGDTLVTTADFFGIAPGDDLEIVDCPVKIGVPHEVYMKGKFPITTLTEINDGQIESPSTPWFCSAGIHWQAENGFSGNLNQAFSFERMKMFHTFSKFTNGDPGKRVMRLEQVESNYTSLPAGTFDYPLFDTWDQIALHVCSGGIAPSSKTQALQLIESLVQQFCTREEVRIEGERRTNLSYSLVGGIDAFHAHFNTDGTYLGQIGFTDTGVNMLQSSAEIIALHIAGSTIGIMASDASYINAAWLQGLCTDDEALHLQHKSMCMVDDVPNVTLTGAVDDVIFSYYGLIYSWRAAGSANLVSTTSGDVLGAG